MVGKESELVTMYISSRDVLEWAIDKENALANHRKQILEILRAHEVNHDSDGPTRRLARQVRDAPNVYETYELLLPFTRDLAALTGDKGLVEPHTLSLVTNFKPQTVSLLIEAMLADNLLQPTDFEGETFYKPRPPIDKQ